LTISAAQLADLAVVVAAADLIQPRANHCRSNLTTLAIQNDKMIVGGASVPASLVVKMIWLRLVSSLAPPKQIELGYEREIGILQKENQ
jgi:hypothetical protein